MLTQLITISIYLILWMCVTSCKASKRAASADDETPSGVVVSPAETQVESESPVSQLSTTLDATIGLSLTQTMRPTGNNITFTGTASIEDATGALIKLIIKNSTSGQCLNVGKTAFDSECPSYLNTEVASIWSLSLDKDLFIHNTSYEISAIITKGSEKTQTTTADFLYKQATLMLLDEIVFDAGTTQDEAFRDILVLNDGIYAVGYEYDLLAGGTSARDVVLRKFDFNGSLVTSGFWASPSNYAYNFGTDGEYPNCLTTDGEGNLFVSGHGVGSQFVIKFNTDGQQLNSFRVAGSKEGACNDIYENNLYLAGSDDDQAGDGPGGTDTNRDWTIKKLDFDLTEDTSGNWPAGVDSGSQTFDKAFNAKLDSSGIYAIGVYDNPGVIDYYVRRFELDGSLSWSTFVGSAANTATMPRVLIIGNEIWASAPIENALSGSSNDDWVVAVFDKTTGAEIVSKRNAFGSLTHRDGPRALIYHEASDTVLVGGFIGDPGQQENWMIKGINRADGSVDSSLDLTQDFGGLNDKINSLFIDSDGDVYAVGYATDYVGAGTGRDAIIRRFSGP